MSILDTIKKVMPYLKTDSGYVLCRLSSQAVEMDDGLTLEQKVTSLNSLIESKVDTSSVVNNALTTEEGFVLDARQGKVMDDKITELNGKLINKTTPVEYDKTVINFTSAWTIHHCEVYKTGRIVQLSARIYSGTILKDHEYTIANVNTEFRPAHETPIYAVAGDVYMQNLVPCMCSIQPDGKISFKASGEQKQYVDIAGTYIL